MTSTTRDKKRDTAIKWISARDKKGYLKLSTDARAGNLLCKDSGHGVLVTELPAPSFAQLKRPGLAWFPAGIPSGKSVTIASSRIGNQPDTKTYVFDAIRTICCRMAREKKFVVTHSGIATHRFVRRAAELFGVPLVEFRPFPTAADSSWFEEVLNAEESPVAYYLSDLKSELSNAGKSNAFADQWLAGIAQEMFLLSVRAKGNVFKCVEQRLDSAGPSNLTYLLTESPDTTRSTSDTLLDSGAIAWHLIQHIAPTASPIVRAPFKHLNEFKQLHRLDEYLVHWTRRRDGPWPNQTEQQFIDDLILGLSSSDHSKLAALLRILATQTLLASNRITRDSTPVVSFTENQVDQLSELRTFRSHLSRWDFETIGIAISRNVLKRTGARPVIYGDDADFETLSNEDRPFFQMQGTSIDWRMEKEWRTIGNVDLNRLGPNDAFLFVDSAEHAEKISAYSKWEVVLIERD